MQGFAPGGITEQPPSLVAESSISCMLAEEMGMFGFKPHVLMDVLAGRRASVAASVSSFWRLLSGDLSPLDLETAMQLIHKLFTTEVLPCHSYMHACATASRPFDALRAILGAGLAMRVILSGMRSRPRAQRCGASAPRVAVAQP